MEKTETADIWIENDGIIRIINYPDVRLNKESANTNITIVQKLSEGRVYPILIDISTILSITPEARKIFAATTSVSAVALIIKSPLSKFIGNFFLNLYHTEIPNRLFDNEEKAITWLKQYCKWSLSS